MANECQIISRATGCVPDPSRPVADRLAEVLPAVGVAVRVRMEAMGQFREGRCLTAAVVGVVELRAAGFDAVLQAGSCYWRRIPEAVARDRGAAEDGRVRWHRPGSVGHADAEGLGRAWDAAGTPGGTTCDA